VPQPRQISAAAPMPIDRGKCKKMVEIENKKEKKGNIDWEYKEYSDIIQKLKLDK